VSETDLSRSIRSALEATGAWVERIQAGKHRVKGGVLVCASPGTPDLLVLWPRVVFLEVKLPKGKLKPTQELWHARAQAAGLRVAVVRSVAEALEAVRS
jgi:hypothetical protein